MPLVRVCPETLSAPECRAAARPGRAGYCGEAVLAAPAPGRRAGPSTGGPGPPGPPGSAALPGAGARRRERASCPAPAAAGGSGRCRRGRGAPGPGADRRGRPGAAGIGGAAGDGAGTAGVPPGPAGVRAPAPPGRRGRPCAAVTCPGPPRDAGDGRPPRLPRAQSSGMPSRTGAPARGPAPGPRRTGPPSAGPCRAGSRRAGPAGADRRWSTGELPARLRRVRPGGLARREPVAVCSARLRRDRLRGAARTASRRRAGPRWPVRRRSQARRARPPRPRGGRRARVAAARPRRRPSTGVRMTTGGIGRDPGMLIRIRVVSVVSVLRLLRLGRRRLRRPASGAVLRRSSDGLAGSVRRRARRVRGSAAPLGPGGRTVSFTTQSRFSRLAPPPDH